MSNARSPVPNSPRQLPRQRVRAARQLAALGAALASLLGVSRSGHAQEDRPAQRDTASARAAAPAVSYALGVSLGFLRQQGLGESTELSFIPSLLGVAYVPLAPRAYLRPGLRLGYSGLSQADTSFGARIEERGVQATAELGAIYDAWLVPSLTLGAGVDQRSIDFVGRGIVSNSDAIDRSEWLGLVYAQAGLGLPLFRGALVVEPYARLQHTFSDDRSRSQFGFDLTFAL